jgi:hypothetical protein
MATKGQRQKPVFLTGYISLQASLRDNGPLTHSAKANALLLPNDQYTSHGKVLIMRVQGNVRRAHRKHSACSSSSIRDYIYLPTYFLYRSQ